MAPDGSTAYVVRCRGNSANCYKRAEKSCPLGYEVLPDSVESQQAAPQVNINVNSPPPIAGPKRGQMIIRCR